MSNTISSQPRILFLGMQSDFSHPPLRALLESGIDVCAVVIAAASQTAHRAVIHRREHPHTVHSLLPLLNSSILQLAWQRQIPVWEVQHISHPQVVSALAVYQADIICISCFPQRIPRIILDLPRLGCLNVHPSLLPDNRGPVPLFWTFREGCEQTGVTIHLMDEAMDSGDILAQQPINVPDGISYLQLESQCALRAGELLAQAVWDLHRGLATPLAQDETQSSYHPFPSAEDFVVHAAEWSARHVYNFVCGVGHWGEPIKLHTDDKIVFVREAFSYSHKSTDDIPSGAGLRVRCKIGWVSISPPPA